MNSLEDIERGSFLIVKKVDENTYIPIAVTPEFLDGIVDGLKCAIDHGGLVLMNDQVLLASATR